MKAALFLYHAKKRIKKAFEVLMLGEESLQMAYDPLAPRVFAWKSSKELAAIADVGTQQVAAMAAAASLEGNGIGSGLMSDRRNRALVRSVREVALARAVQDTETIRMPVHPDLKGIVWYQFDHMLDILTILENAVVRYQQDFSGKLPEMFYISYGRFVEFARCVGCYTPDKARYYVKGTTALTCGHRVQVATRHEVHFTVQESLTVSTIGVR